MSIPRQNIDGKVQGAKCIVVGDESVGKSSLIATYTTKIFPTSEDVIAVFDKSSSYVSLGSSTVHLDIWDLPAQDSYTKLRALSYAQCDVFIICFSIASPPTFENVFRKWYLEISQICPDVPFLLVGCKNDLRIDDTTIKRLHEHSMKPISIKQAQRMKRRLGACEYIECSSFCQDQVNGVFEEACRMALLNRATSKSMKLSSSMPTRTTAYGSLKFKNVKLPFEELMDETIPSTNDVMNKHKADLLSASEDNRVRTKRNERKRRHRSMKIPCTTFSQSTESKSRKDSCVIS